MKVHQHHVGPQPLSRRWDFGAIGALAEDRDTSLATKGYRQHLAEQRLVVDEENANHVSPFSAMWRRCARFPGRQLVCQRCAAADSFDLGRSPSCALIRIEKVSIATAVRSRHGAATPRAVVWA